MRRSRPSPTPGLFPGVYAFPPMARLPNEAILMVASKGVRMSVCLTEQIHPERFPVIGVREQRGFTRRFRPEDRGVNTRAGTARRAQRHGRRRIAVRQR